MLLSKGVYVQLSLKEDVNSLSFFKANFHKVLRVEYYHPLSPRTARRYYKEIIKHVKKLSTFPAIGRIVPEFEEDYLDKYREIIFEKYRIIYRMGFTKIFIVRIIDSRRLLPVDFVKDSFNPE